MRRANGWILAMALAAFAALFLWSHRSELVPARRLAPIATVEGAAIEDGGYLLNLNTASEADLVTLPGVGEVLAARIVAHREANGAFSSVDALDDVEGVGTKTIDELRRFVTVK